MRHYNVGLVYPATLRSIGQKHRERVKLKIPTPDTSDISLNRGTPPGAEDSELSISDISLNQRTPPGAEDSENGSLCTCLETAHELSYSEPGKSETY